MSFGVALHVLLVLARYNEGRMKSAQLAASVGANPVTIRRVIGHLHKAGLVDTQSGPGGGAALARPAQDISVAEVHAAVGSPSWIKGHENQPNSKCDVSVCMPRVFYRLERAIHDGVAPILGGTTLQQLVDDEFIGA